MIEIVHGVSPIGSLSHSIRVFIETEDVHIIIDEYYVVVIKIPNKRFIENS